MDRIKSFIFNNQFISGSLVVIASATFVNFGNYIFHLLMGRMLGPVNYGSLNSLIAIFYLLFIPSLALLTVIIKFTTIYQARNEYGRLYSLFRSFTEKLSIVGVCVLLFFIFAQKPIAEFLNISDASSVALVGTFVLFSLLSTVNNGILQGLLNFNFYSANNIFSIILKVGFGFLLVKLGFSVNGAILAILISYVLPYLTSLYPLRFLWLYSPKFIKINRREIITYAWPATLVALGTTSLYSTDIILVKHFFPAFEAGLYAAISVIGKIIYFSSGTISVVMFPLISERFEKGKHYQSILYQALFLVILSSFALIIIYFFWPSLMLRLLYGSSYLVGAPYLGYFAIFISIYSLDNLLIQFFLSIRQTKIASFALVAALLQGLLIWFYHKNFFQVIYSSIFVSSLLFISLLVYYFLYIRKNTLK